MYYDKNKRWILVLLEILCYHVNLEFLLPVLILFSLRICIQIFDKYLQPTVKKLFHTRSYLDLFYAIIY